MIHLFSLQIHMGDVLYVTQSIVCAFYILYLYLLHFEFILPYFEFRVINFVILWYIYSLIENFY